MTGSPDSPPPPDPQNNAEGEFDPRDASGLLTAPEWLRSLGVTAWLAVGVTLFVLALVWILSLMHTIVAPVITASVVAAVASPLVALLGRHRVKRGLAAALVLVSLVVLSVALVGITVGGITGQADELRPKLESAKQDLVGYAADLGIPRDSAEAAKDDASSAVSEAVPALLHGVVGGLEELASLVLYLSFTALSLFFLLKDGPQIRRWAEGHMRMPRPVAHRMGQHVIDSLRGYFLGVTFVAIFNTVLIAGGALVIGVPLVGTIAIVTFLGAYIPYLGAWSAGAFTVLVALGGAGPEEALAMIVIQLLANGILQQMVQPLAMGAALKLHPLAVLIVTIAGGALFGAVGLILAAPLTAAATRIADDMSARAEAAESPAPPGQPDVAAGPAVAT